MWKHFYREFIDFRGGCTRSYKLNLSDKGDDSFILPFWECYMLASNYNMIWELNFEVIKIIEIFNNHGF